MMWFEKHLKNVSSFLTSVLPIRSISFDESTPILFVFPSDLYNVLKVLKYHTPFQYSSLVTMVGVDYPSRKRRFQVIYLLLSIPLNIRMHVKTFVSEIDILPTLKSLYSSCIWCEREVWDMFGVFFDSNESLKRLLTDYGFEGHPLRKDFPLSGYVEVRYDEASKRVVCEPIEHAQEFRFFQFNSFYS